MIDQDIVSCFPNGLLQRNEVEVGRPLVPVQKVKIKLELRRILNPDLYTAAFFCDSLGSEIVFPNMCLKRLARKVFMGDRDKISDDFCLDAPFAKGPCDNTAQIIGVKIDFLKGAHGNKLLFWFEKGHQIDRVLVCQVILKALILVDLLRSKQRKILERTGKI